MEKKYFNMIRPYINVPYQIAILGIALITTALGVSIPLVYSYIIDSVILKAKIEILLYSTITFLIIIVLQGIISFVQSYLVSRLGEKIGNQLRKNVYAKIETLDSISKSHYGSANIISLFNNDIFQVTGLISSIILSFILQTITLFVILIVLFILNIKLALCSFIVIPLYFLLFFIMAMRIQKASQERQETFVDINTQLQEDISGLSFLQIWNAIGYRRKLFHRILEKFFKSNIKLSVYSNLISELSSFIASIGNVIVICVGAYMIMRNEVTLGVVVASQDYISRLFVPIISILSIKQNIAIATPSLDRIFGFLNIESKINDVDSSKQLVEDIHKINLSDIRISYGNKDAILKDINISIPIGKFTAIIGESGSGKSSLCNIIARIIAPDSGYIFINDNNIEEYTLQSIRQKLYIVQQEPMIYKDSIRDNILLGEEFDDARVKEALDFSCINIDNHKKNLDLVVGENGFTLSGGEKRRLSIARAFIRDYQVIILDEPTSGLDNITRKKLIDNLLHESDLGKTIIVASHHPYDFQYADMILVLKDGVLLDSGTHCELMERSEYYLKMLNQTREYVVD